MYERDLNIVPKDISRLRSGNREVFGQVFQRYNQQLYFFALGYLKSERDAEEIVQETFLKLWERRRGLKPELSVQAYLFKIAFNFIRKRWQVHLKDEELKHRLAGELVDFDNQTDQQLNYHFLLHHINQLMDELPPRQKEIIEFRKLDGLSTREISEKLSISGKTVEAHLTAALKFLRAKLQSEKFEDLLLLAIIFRKNIQRD
ncbi:MAG TPA: RNA polymerase sigma-70 factor [Sunxiuqinia sp.]|nr:RNA polymerase sigma-70 factor [Sunxiuqinia sp.]